MILLCMMVYHKKITYLVATYVFFGRIVSPNCRIMSNCCRTPIRWSVRLLWKTSISPRYVMTLCNPRVKCLMCFVKVDGVPANPEAKTTATFKLDSRTRWSVCNQGAKRFANSLDLNRSWWETWLSRASETYFPDSTWTLAKLESCDSICDNQHIIAMSHPVRGRMRLSTGTVVGLLTDKIMTFCMVFVDPGMSVKTTE